MIRYIYARDLAQFPTLSDTMFRDRATQFNDRLGWEVNVDETGWERDEYDFINPLYLIWQNPDGTHGASMRVLPTVGRTMVNEHFAHLNGGLAIRGQRIWECTRFCVSPDQSETGFYLAGALMLGAQELGLRFGLSKSVGVYDMRMTRIYRKIGWVPELIGYGGTGRNRVCLGLWSFGREIRDRIAENAGLDCASAEAWFDASFPSQGQRLAA